MSENHIQKIEHDLLKKSSLLQSLQTKKQEWFNTSKKLGEYVGTRTIIEEKIMRSMTLLNNISNYVLCPTYVEFLNGQLAIDAVLVKLEELTVDINKFTGIKNELESELTELEKELSALSPKQTEEQLNETFNEQR